MFSTIGSNDLVALKQYLESDNSGIDTNHDINTSFESY